MVLSAAAAATATPVASISNDDDKNFIVMFLVVLPGLENKVSFRASCEV